MKSTAAIAVVLAALAIATLSAGKVKECVVCKPDGEKCETDLFCNKIEVVSGPKGFDSGNACLCTKAGGGQSLANSACAKAILPNLINGNSVQLKSDGTCPK